MSEKPMTVAEMARMGGLARAQAYSKAQIRAWGKLGGRPSALTVNQGQRIAEWTRHGIGQRTIAERLGVSLRTVGRYLKRLRGHRRSESRL